MSEVVYAKPVAHAYNTASVRDYFDLLKPRVMSLVVFTALVGMLAAPGEANPVLAAVSLLAIAVGAGASGALNMWFDADIDGKMARTRRRPVPAGRIGKSEAAGFGGAMAALSVLLLALASNYLAAVLLAATIGFYVLVYTMWLKRRTPQNIVIGGAAGAAPPVIGWAAVTGEVTLTPLAFFLIIFMWTPPHFWALSLYKAGDYEAAGVPMLPVVKGEAQTRRHIWIYSLLLVPVTFAPLFLGAAGLAYGAAAAVGGAIFLVLAFRVRRGPQTLAEENDRSLYEVAAANRAARNLFAFSILYLFMLFAALLAEHAFGWA
ncbi:MAG: heme o synthase [Pseudomonadota bacterium]